MHFSPDSVNSVVFQVLPLLRKIFSQEEGFFLTSKMHMACVTLPDSPFIVKNQRFYG
jgi:hypothetical protein